MRNIKCSMFICAQAHPLNVDKDLSAAFNIPIGFKFKKIPSFLDV